MKKFNIIISLVLAMIMLLSIALPVFAAEPESSSTAKPEITPTSAPKIYERIDLNIFAKNIEIGESVDIKYAVPYEGKDNIKMLFWTAAQAEYTVDTAELNADAEGTENVLGRTALIFRYDALKDEQLTDIVYARAYTVDEDGDYLYGDVTRYSVLQYVYNTRIYEKLSAKAYQLLTDLLDRGAAAQIEKEYKLDDLANEPHNQINMVGQALADGFSAFLLPSEKEIAGIERYMITAGGAYYFINNDQIYTGYQAVGNYMYYFDGNNGAKKNVEFDGHTFNKFGQLVANNEFEAVDGNTYYFTNNKITREYSIIDGKLYYFGKDGIMAADTSIDGYKIDADGVVTAENDYIYTPKNAYYIVDDEVICSYAYFKGGVFLESGKKLIPTIAYRNTLSGPSGPLAGVDCIARVNSMNISFYTTTDDEGVFVFPLLPRLEITFIFLVEGFESNEVTVDLSKDVSITPIVLGKTYSDGLEYEKTDKEEYKVTGMGDCTDVCVIVPEEHEGLPVTEIGEKAFQGCNTVISITLPNSITKIYDKAFADCSALENIDMPDSVEIGLDVFRGSISVTITINHQVEFIPAKKATCTEPGNIAYYWCRTCDLFYADAEQTERLYNVTIPNSHTFEGGACTDCGKIQNEILITSIDAVNNLGKFALGTLENAIGLPTNINVRTADGRYHSLPIVWDMSTYDKSNVGKYTINGIIQAGEFRFNDGLSNSVSAELEIVDFMKGTADIVFILDISGSMGDEINNVKNNLQNFAQAIEDMGVSARWAGITYSDFTCSTDPKEQSTIMMNGASDWFTSVPAYKNAIGNIRLAYGGDAPETALDGLMLANTLSTRKDARVFYILLTDDTCKNTNHYGVSDLYEAADILGSQNINISTITPTSYYRHYSMLTSATGGIQANIYSNFAQTLLNELVPIIYGEVID